MSLSRARSIQSTLSKHISLKFILTLYSHLIVVLAGTLFHSCPPPPSPPYVHAIRRAHDILLDSFIRIITGDKYK